MSTILFEKAQAVFKQKWGHSDFRKAQKCVIEQALAGQDVLAVLSTGYGKSATFQVPAIVQPGCALVISPLIALMKDQCDDCLAMGIPASYVNSHVSTEEMSVRLKGFANGEYKVFYVAPERLGMSSFRDAMREAEINYLVIDEAHCAAQWGHDFRPSYMRIHEVLEILQAAGKRPPVLALTATATADIEGDIAKAIGMREDYFRIVGDPIRSNLSYQVMRGNPWRNIGRICDGWRVDGEIESRYIVYAATRKGAEKVAELIGEELGRGSVGFYHAGMSRETRTSMQDDFKSGRVPIVVATSAFGMGIDVPNIRTVVHFGIPGSLEDYTQQSGRAGRDGKESKVILLYDEKSADIQQFFLDSNNPPTHLYQKLWDWLLLSLPEQGQKLRKSARGIAIECSRYAKENMTDGQVSTMLNIMESEGLVGRGYSAQKTPMTVFPAALRRVVKGEVRLRPMTTRLANHLWGAHGGEDQTRSYALTVSKPDLCAKNSMSDSSLRTALKSLHEEGVLIVGTTFTGKTTEILLGDTTDIHEALPMEDLEQKRARDQRRLDRMIAYMDNPDPIKMIRDYFLKT
jgi:ATP-dependent DNA helicase RecQ